jgi:hypothetical protein
MFIVYEDKGFSNAPRKMFTTVSDRGNARRMFAVCTLLLIL